MKSLKIISGILFVASLAALVLVGYLIVTGFPAPEWLSFIKMKSLRKPAQIFLALFLASILIHPDRASKMKRLGGALSHPASVWVLTGVYALIFLWHEIAEYLSVEINFLPFSFYDYMLYYFPQGKFHFTGFLHGFYHINNAMFLLAPLWHFYQNSFLLILVYPLILAGAGVPLYFLARRYFEHSAVPFVAVFTYLNYRYLQNVLDMNFTVEGFYPLFLFSLILFAAGQKWFWYGIFLLLTLSVKEDAPFYLAVFGFLLLWMRGKRIAGLLTIASSAAYFIFIQHFLVVWTGSDIFKGSAENFAKYGSSPFQILGYFALHIPEILKEFLGTKEAWKTLSKAFGSLMLLPVLSPYAIGGLAALFPCFVRGGESFLNLQFQYSAPFIGFVFPALVDGLRRVWKRVAVIPQWREPLFAIILILLVFLNCGNLRIPRIEKDDLKTIALAKSIPVDAVLVTHGHLLPYIGYRKENFFFQAPLEDKEHPHALKPVYDHADYYLMARGINLYPMNEDFFENKLKELKSRSDLELIQDDGVRYLFKKK